MAATLITLPEAKTHLRITTAAHDADVQMKLDQAEALILHFLKAQADPTWDATTVPPPVKAAILLYLTRLYEQRGDSETNDEQVWLSIGRLLVGYRDPALA
jgi:uncharacterized protein HemY